jgi:hypothetical protein
VTPGDDKSPGDGFFRDMGAQSARAHDFESRLRWTRLSKRLRADADDVDAHAAGAALAPGADAAPGGAQAAEPDVIDLREDGAATSSEGPGVPRQRR